jgi:imidazolonepropionase
VTCDLLITGAKGLVQVRESHYGPVAGKAMDELPVMPDAWISVSNGRISGYGPMSGMPSFNAKKKIDAQGRFVFPSFVDSHTHLVFAASREEEFEMKIKGLSYQEIAKRGGGILNSARKLREASEESLIEATLQRAKEIITSGTGAVEIKSGYGLTLESELKMLRVARKVGELSPLTVRTTFLGAHAVPDGMSRPHYVKQLTEEMIPAVGESGLADYIDVFCEEGFFSPEETIAIANRGKEFGMKPRIHANQLARSGGVQAAVACGAVSADHLEQMGDEEIEALKSSDVMPTALPGAAFFLGLPYPPARRMISEGLPLAIASDFNPGSCPTGNMPLMLSLACIAMKLTPAEAFNASTLNTALTLGLEREMGSITRGKLANLIITRPAPSVTHLPYAFGSPMADTVILKGSIVTAS